MPFFRQYYKTIIAIGISILLFEQLACFLFAIIGWAGPYSWLAFCISIFVTPILIILLKRTRELFYRSVLSVCISVSLSLLGDLLLRRFFVLSEKQYILMLACLTGTITVFIFLLTDFMYSISFFRISPDYLKIRKGIKFFIRKNKELTEEKAQIAIELILMQKNEERTTLSCTLEEYFRLLSAGVRIAQNQWFATYLLDINSWIEFGTTAESYQRTLRNTDIYKVRYVIRPYEEINNVTERTPLVGATIEAGAAIKFIPEETLENQTARPANFKRDFAIFDCERDYSFVITARSMVENKRLDELKPTDLVEVDILKGTKTDEYRHLKNFLSDNSERARSFAPLMNLDKMREEAPLELSPTDIRRFLHGFSSYKIKENEVFARTTKSALHTLVSMVDQIIQNNRIDVRFVTPFSIYEPIMDSGVNEVLATSLVQTEKFWNSEIGERYWILNKRLLENGGKTTRIFLLKDFSEFSESESVILSQIIFKYKMQSKLQNNFRLFLARLNSISNEHQKDVAIYRKGNKDFCAVEIGIVGEIRAPNEMCVSFNSDDIQTIKGLFDNIISSAKEFRSSSMKKSKINEASLKKEIRAFAKNVVQN